MSEYTLPVKERELFIDFNQPLFVALKTIPTSTQALHESLCQKSSRNDPKQKLQTVYDIIGHLLNTPMKKQVEYTSLLLSNLLVALDSSFPLLRAVLFRVTLEVGEVAL